MSLLYIANQFAGISQNYIEDPNRVKDFYPLSYHETNHFDRRRTEVMEGNYQRQELSKILYENNKNIGASKETFDACKRLAQSESLVVVTGQQAGLATGPLFTLYKAARAISLANSLAEKWNVPVIPVFWVASEDHDFEEISSVHLFENHKLKTLVIHKPDHLKRSVGSYLLSDDEEKMIEEIIQMTGGQLYSNEIASILSRTFKRGEGYGQWFGRLILEVFKKQGLVVVDPMWSDIRQMQSSFFQTTIERQNEIHCAFVNQTERLKQFDFVPAINLQENHSNLFMYVNEERLAVKFDSNENRYWIDGQEGEKDFTKEEMLRLAAEEPTRLSTNVVLRPIVQDFIFPVISYVGGPGEIAYHAQLTTLYPLFNRKMPIMLPRLQVTIVSNPMKKMADQIGIHLNELFQKSTQEIESELLNEKDLIGINNKFDVFNSTFENAYNELIKGLDVLHPEMKELISKNHGMIHGQISYLYDKSHSYHRRQNKDLLKCFSTLQHGIKPMGEAQERVLNFTSVYAELGQTWLDHMIDVPYNEMRHVVMVVDHEEV